jgi:hypothetical protein
MKLTRQGVRDLDADAREEARKPIVPDPETFEDEEKIQKDLLYCDCEELREEILSAWPQAKLNSIWDNIHEGRLEVQLMSTQVDYFRWLIRSGWAELSFLFQFCMLDERNRHFVISALDGEKPGWRKTDRKSDELQRRP